MWHERKMELITTIYDKIDEMAELELGETINDEPSKPSKRSRSIRSDLESGDSMNEEPSEPSKPIKPTKKSTICLKVGRIAFYSRERGSTTSLKKGRSHWYD